MVLQRLAAPVAALALAGFIGGCSLAIPLPSLSATDEDSTGSIERSGSPLGPAMEQEDWRRANAALGVALDPQGNGAPVQWNNPISGAKGSFVQTGRPYPFEAVVCRPFAAELTLRAGEHALVGSACVDKSGDWTVRDARPRKKA